MKKIDAMDINLGIFIIALATLIALGYDGTLERVFVGIAVVWLGGNQAIKRRKHG